MQHHVVVTLDVFFFHAGTKFIYFLVILLVSKSEREGNDKVCYHLGGKWWVVKGKCHEVKRNTTHHRGAIHNLKSLLIHANLVDGLEDAMFSSAGWITWS